LNISAPVDVLNGRNILFANVLEKRYWERQQNIDEGAANDLEQT
jgi:hypothetical protein